MGIFKNYIVPKIGDILEWVQNKAEDFVYTSMERRGISVPPRMYREISYKDKQNHSD